MTPSAMMLRGTEDAKMLSPYYDDFGCSQLCDY